MPSRRFLVLATVLVLLNAALWLAPGALALRQVVVSTLFGPNMVRADVVTRSRGEWRIDRGIVLTATPTLLRLREADLKVQAIAISSATRASYAGNPVGLGSIKPGWRVLVTWPAPSGPADAVVIERRGSG